MGSSPRNELDKLYLNSYFPSSTTVTHLLAYKCKKANVCIELVSNALWCSYTFPDFVLDAFVAVQLAAYPFLYTDIISQQLLDKKLYS